MTSLNSLYQVAKAIPELAWIARAGRVKALAQCSPSEQEQLDSLGSADGILLFLPPSQNCGGQGEGQKAETWKEEGTHRWQNWGAAPAWDICPADSE